MAEARGQARLERHLVPRRDGGTAVALFARLGLANRLNDPADDLLEPRPPALDVRAHDRDALAAREDLARDAGEALATPIVNASRGLPRRWRGAINRVESSLERLLERPAGR